MGNLQSIPGGLKVWVGTVNHVNAAQCPVNVSEEYVFEWVVHFLLLRGKQLGVLVIIGSTWQIKFGCRGRVVLCQHVHNMLVQYAVCIWHRLAVGNVALLQAQ